MTGTPAAGLGHAVAVRLGQEHMQGVGELRFEPIGYRVRAAVGDRPLVDSRRAVLVWEPDRVVPSYAVPAGDVQAQLVASEHPPPSPAEAPYFQVPGGQRILLPGSFGVHTCDGETLDLRWDGGVLAGAAFRPADPALDGLVVLDFAAFDEWLEEEDRALGHPRDPFKRIDVRRSLRHVVVQADGVLLAESTRPALLFETLRPVRYYLPADDVRLDLLEPSDTRSVCAYKGEARYWAVERDGSLVDVAWSYPQPLSDARDVVDMVCFLDRQVDVTVDGRPLEPAGPF